MKSFKNFTYFFLLQLLFVTSSFAQDTWYSYQTGQWGDFNTWTKDGATAPTFVNPSSETPNAGDFVVIRNAHAITMQDGSSALLNSVTISSITIRTGSSVNLLNSSGHNFTDISGGGTVFMTGVRNENGDGVGANDVYEENLPEGDYRDFADALLGGTIEVNSGANNIPFIFNDNLAGITATASGAISRRLRINMGDSDDRAVIQRNIAVVGDLIVNQGNLQIHSDNVETYEGGSFSGGAISNVNLTITIVENVTINANGQITTGTANQRHQFNIDGNFTNNGVNTTSFTQRTTQNIGAEATDGIVDLNFLNTVENQSLVSNGPANFYRIEIDKGNPAIELSIEASAPANFNLLGFANQGHGFTSQLTSNTNALGLISGTVRLRTNADVEPLSGGAGNYNVSENASLVVDGAFVSKSAGPAIVPYGSIIVDSGTLVSSVGSGVTTRDNGTLRVNVGTVYISQFRTSVAGASAVGGYEQNGGTVTVGDFAGIIGPSGTSYSNSNPSGDFYTFSLTYEGNVFVMSGGTLNVTEPSDDAQGSVFINSSPDNVNVTGGTVNVTSTNDGEARITSRAPFFNLNIRNTTTSTATTRRVTVGTGTSGSGGGASTITNPDLKVLNDLTIETGTTRTLGDDTYGGYLDLCPSGTCADLEIGRNLTIQNNAVLDVFSGAADNANSSRVTFNGILDSEFTVGDVTSYDLSLTGYIDPEGDTPYTNWEYPLYNMTVDKPTGITLTLAATGTSYDAGNTAAISDGSGNKNINTTRSNIVKVANDFVLESGRVDLDLYSIRLYAEVTNKGILGIDADPVNAQVKLRESGFGETRTIVTQDGAEFGNLRVNSGSGLIAFSSDVYVKRLLYKHGRINIGSNNLKIDNLVFALTGEAVGSDFGVQDMIIMNGNPSDGGLSLYVPGLNNPGLSDSQADVPTFLSTVYFFPIGTGTTNAYPGSQYTPFNLRLAAGGFTDDGYITVNVVNSQLQTAGPHPLGNDVLNRYFRVRHEGFGTVPKVERYRATVTEVDIPDGTNDTEMIDNGSQVWSPAFILDSTPFTRNYETNNGATASSGFRDLSAENIQIFFWGNTWNGASFVGNPTAGFDLVEANYTAGNSSKFAGEPLIFYSREDNFNTNWNEGESWNSEAEIAADPIGGDVTDEHDDDINQIVGNTEGVDFPGPGDIAVLGVNPDTGIPQSIRIQGAITVQAAEFRFAQNATIVNAGRGGFSFYPELIINNNGSTPTINIGQIIGRGVITDRNNTDPDLSSIDLGAFNSEDNSYILLENFQNNFTYNNIPATVPNLILSADGFGDNDRTTILANDIEVRGDLIVAGGVNLQLNTASSTDGDIVVNGDLQVVNGFEIFPGTQIGDGVNADPELRFPGSGGGAVPSRTVLVKGDLVLTRRGARVVISNAGANASNHSLTVEGDIIDNSGDADGGIDLRNNTDYVTLTFTGTESSRMTRSNTSNAPPDLYDLTLSKVGISDTLNIQTDFDLPLPSAIGKQPLEIVNGFLILNNAGIDITLTDAARGNFRLPNLNNADASSGSGGLEIANGIVRIVGANTGVELDGPLVLSGGDADFADGTNNNFIQYSVSGSARITINNAASELRVGTQIRRTTFSTAGILNLQVTAGNLFIGEGGGGELSRGVLEILNSGSAFTHTGGTITLLSDNNYGSAPTVASLFLEPTTSNLAGSNIVVNLTNNDRDFSINSTVALNNLTLQSTSGAGSETVELLTRPLTINGNLAVENDINLQSNGLALTVNGNFTLINTATYTPGTNTTTINVASGTNTLSGVVAPSFFNFSKTGTGTLQLGSNISISGATFVISAGTINDSGNSITFTGQSMTNNGTHSSPSNSNTNGIIFRGAAQQILQTSGTGVFGNLIIDNTAGVALPDVSQTIRINNRLVLDAGIIDIGPALMVFSANAEIVGDAASEDSYGSNFSNFSEASQIQTNSSIIDFGIEKEFNPGTTTDFTFPVGEATRYTPAEISFSTATGGTSGSTSGSVRIRPKNSVAPIMLSRSQAIQDAILQYYWLVNSIDLTGFTADLLFNYDDEVVGTDAESTYEGALAFFADTDNGVSDGIGTVDEATNIITIPLNMPISVPADSLTNDENFSGEYFAGDPARIPDEFVTVLYDNNTGNGNVNDPANYCFDSNGDGSCASESRPVNYGSEITGGNISLDEGATMTLNVSNVSFSRTTIPATSTIVIQAGTSGHSFGQISGSGTIQINSNNTNAALPVGDYANFFTSCATGGGALEYGGTGNFTVLNETNQVRNLLLRGAGSKSMVANNVTICQDFEIREGSIEFADAVSVTVNRNFILTAGTVTLGQNGSVTVENDLTLTAGTLNDAVNSTITLKGDLTRTSTNVDLANATLNFEGSSSQQITGTFTSGNELGNMTMNNASGLVLNADVEVTGALTFTNGIINTSVPALANPISTAGVQLIMSATATTTGGSDASYVNGMVTKRNIGTAASFTFPVGASGNYAAVRVSSPNTVTNWTAYYAFSNPQNISNNINFGSDRNISAREYWVVDGSGTAIISIQYGEQSGVANAAALGVGRLKDDNTDGSFTNTDEWALVDVNNSSTDPLDGILTTNNPQSFSSNIYTVAELSSAALPVELIELLATEHARGILVSWKTATEIENYGFQIQRSEMLSELIDDTTWVDLGFVYGAGTVIEEQEYSYLDTSVEVAGKYYYRLLQIDYSTQVNVLGPVTVFKTVPDQTKLLLNYPNPFNPTTTIPYTISSAGKVTISVYNMLGQLISTLVNTSQQPGTYQVQFNAQQLSSGTYFIRMISEGRVSTRKILLVK